LFTRGKQRELKIEVTRVASHFYFRPIAVEKTKCGREWLLLAEWRLIDLCPNRPYKSPTFGSSNGHVQR
jgi:hypothetical protein